MPKRFMFILLGRGSFLILHAQIVSSQADRQSGRAADYAMMVEWKRKIAPAPSMLRRHRSADRL